MPHFNGFPAAYITGNAAPGYSSGTAIKAMEEVAKEVLPAGYGFAWSGMAFEEKKSGGTSANAFIFGIIIVFLVLAAQFESWILPGAVLTAVPFGILGALIFNWLRGLNNDVYFQIGLLVLIGLGAKNAVLRVAFAVDLRKQGLSVMDATIQAGEERLRPIVMTSLAFIFGVLPLAIATGAGANARHSIGTGIMGGMLGETTLAMLYVPLFFYIFETTCRTLGKKEGAGLRQRSPRPRGRPGAHAPATGGRSVDMRPILIVSIIAVILARLYDGTRLQAAGDRYTPVLSLRGDRTRRIRSTPCGGRSFGDPVLDRLIAEALANNRNVKIAAANVEQAAAVLMITRSAFFPADYLQRRRGAPQLSKNNPITPPNPNPFNNFQVFAGANWEIDLWGRIRRLTEAARANLLATEEAQARGYPFPCR